MPQGWFCQWKGLWESCASYMDSRHLHDAWDRHTYNIDIFQNIVHDSRNDGITVASEMGGLLENVKIYNNISYNNSLFGISVVTAPPRPRSNHCII